MFKLLGKKSKTIGVVFVNVAFLGQVFSPAIFFFTNPSFAYADEGGCGVSPQYGGITLNRAAEFLADMSDVTGAYYDQDTNKIVFIGTATTSLPEFDKDDLAVAIKAVIFNNANPSISIDFKNWSEPFGDPNMTVTYVGGIEDTKFAKVLFDADRMLKIYAIGFDENGATTTSSVSGYQSVLNRWIAYGPDLTKNAVSRWWISPQTITLKEATSTDAFVFDQVVMQVQSESMASNMDPAWVSAASDFAANQTQYFDSYAQEIPSYAQIKQLSKIVGVIKWIKDNNIGADFEWAKNYTPIATSTPRETPRITSPNVWSGDNYYFMTGGVDYSTANTYGTDTQATSTTLKTASTAAATSSTDGVHWNFTSGGKNYESVAVSAELFRALGAYSYGAKDASAPTPSTHPLELTRNYSSYSTERDVGFGPGWSFLPATLSNAMPGFTTTCSISGGYSGSFPYKLAVTTAFGRETFTFSCPTGYVADSPRYHSTLTRDADGTFRVVTKDRSTYLFATAAATSTEFKVIQSYDIHSGDSNYFVRKYNWNSSTTTLLTIQDIHPNDPIPAVFNGRNIAFGYTGTSTRITSVVAPTGTTTYTYNGNGDLVTVTDPRGNSTTYTYDPIHMLKTVTNRGNTQIVNNTYDSKKRVATQSDTNGVSKTFTYDETNRSVSWLDSNGRRASDTFDLLARVIQSVNTLGATTTFAYGTTTDAVASTTDPLGRVSSLTYDSKGNVLSFTASNGGQLNYTWNTTNDLTQTSDSRYSSIFGSPRLTKYSYDSRSNVTQSTIADQATTTYTYTPRGQIATTTDSSGNTTQFFYNAYGLPTLVRDKLGQDTSYTYDNAGRITQVVDPAGMTATYSYDANGNKLTASTPASFFQYSYDANDKLTSIVDPVFATTTFTYTRAGKLATTTNALSAATNYFYDSYDNLTKARDALSRDTVYTYDVGDRETSSQLPSSKTRITTYDSANNPLIFTEPNGTIATSTYDSLNRLVSKKAGTATATYVYDSAGRLTGVGISGVGTTTYDFDTRDRVTQATNPFGAVVQYFYDSLDNLTKITYPDNKAVENQFNLAGKVTQQTDWTGGATAYTYTSFGAPSTTTLSNGITVKREYDSANRLATTTYKNASQTILFRQVLNRDARGFITKITEDGSAASSTVTTYQYDLAGRLIGATGSSINKSYGYDQVGNLTTLGNGTATTTYQYSVDDELATSTSVGGEPMGLLNWTHYAVAHVTRLAKAMPQRLIVAAGDIASLLLASGENKYVEKPDRYEVSLKKSADAGESSVEVLKGHPEVRLKKWDGEVNLGVSYRNVQAAMSSVPSTNRVEWKGQKEEVHAYPLTAKEGMEDGGFEVEVYLKEKPATKVFRFTIDGDENLDFFYQPALTQKEIDDGSSRPDNIVGSYAVYHKVKESYNANGGINYATGKAFHIYRPKAIDANNNETWAVLSYANSILSVEVPQEFLDSAAYPVRIDPTFGYTSSGASYQDVAQQNNDISIRVGNAVNLPENGSINSLHASLDMDSGSADQVDVAMFLNVENTATDSHDQVLKIERTDISWTTTDTFYTFTASGEYLSTDDYILNTIADGGDVDGVLRKGRVSYDSTGTRNNYLEQYNFNTYTTGRDESPWTETDSSGSRKYSMYATYVASHLPTAPTSLLTEGQTNPTDIGDSTPEFSAIYNDPDSSDNAVAYKIQVATSSAFANPYWDSGKTSMATTSQGSRSPDISYGGSALASSTAYYWRIKFWDVADAEGAWSTATSSFSLSTPKAYMYDGNGNLLSSTKGGTTKLYSWNSQGLLASSTIGSLSSIFTYDAEGNRIAKITSGWSLPGNTGYQNPSATGATYNDWTNPTNAYSSDNTDATADSIRAPNQDYYNFGFSIPSGVIINGIEVSIEGESEEHSPSDPVGTYTSDVAVRLSWNGGTSWTNLDQKNNIFPNDSGADTIQVWGSATSTWGRTWSEAEFSNANFRVHVDNVDGGDRGITYFDHIKVKVYYTDPDGGITATRYVNDVLAPNALVLAETDASNTPTVFNVWGPSGLISTGPAATSSRIYPLTDWQGSVRFLADSNGNVAASYSYTPYGSATTTATASTTVYQYTGENFDSETSLTYLRARYYDPAIGRFISRDPARGTLDNPLTQNPYVYAVSNPTTYTDPSGKFIPLLLAGAGIAWVLLAPDVLSPCGDINPSSESLALENRVSNFVLVGDIATSLLGNGGGAAKISAKIAGGHAFTKHLDEFAHLGIKTVDEFASHIKAVLTNPSKFKGLEGGRAAFLDETTGTVVIFNPLDPDFGTALIPKFTDAISYFNGLK